LSSSPSSPSRSPASKTTPSTSSRPDCSKAPARGTCGVRRGCSRPTSWISGRRPPSRPAHRCPSPRRTTDDVHDSVI